MVSTTVAETENLLGQLAADMWDTEKVGSMVDSSVSWQAVEMAELTDMPRKRINTVMFLYYYSYIYRKRRPTNSKKKHTRG